MINDEGKSVCGSCSKEVNSNLTDLDDNEDCLECANDSVKCQKRLTNIAERYKATVDWSESRGEIIIDTPAGFVWNCNGAHCICEAFSNNGGQRFVQEAGKELKESMEYGIQPCNEADCDVCGA